MLSSPMNSKYQEEIETRSETWRTQRNLVQEKKGYRNLRKIGKRSVMETKGHFNHSQMHQKNPVR